MGLYYDVIHPCDFAPKDASIFTRIDAIEKTWSVRIKRTLVRTSPTQGSSKRTAKSRYYTKSLGTTSKEEAITKARDIFFDFRSQEKRGIAPSSRNFSHLFWDWFETVHSVESRMLTIRSRGDDLIYFFGNGNITSIDSRSWESYLKWRCSPARYEWKKTFVADKLADGAKYRGGHIRPIPARKSLQADRQMLGQFLRWARKENYITVVPYLEARFENVIRDPTGLNFAFRDGRVRAKALPKTTWRSIRGCLQHLAHPQPPNKYHSNPRIRFARIRLFNFLWFCYGSLARTSEARHLLWTDLTPEEDEDGLFYVVLIRKPKATAHAYRSGRMVRGTVLSRQQSSLIPEWKRFLMEIGHYQDDGHIFPCWTNAADRTPGWKTKPVEVHLMSRLFQRLLKEKNLTHTRDGLKISMNSWCRHSSIRDAICDSPQTIADTALRAGNTLQTISTHYLEMYVEDNAPKLASLQPHDRGRAWGVREPRMDRAVKSAAPAKQIKEADDDDLQEEVPSIGWADLGY